MRSPAGRACAFLLALGSLGAGPSRSSVSVLDFGAKPDGVTDNSPAFQKAVDAAIASRWDFGSRGGARVVIPAASQPYQIRQSIFVDAPNLEIVGEGAGSVVQVHPYFEGPAFIFGVPRRQPVSKATAAAPSPGQKAGWTAEYRPEAQGTLDASAAPRKGVRFGLRTRGDATLILQAHPLQLGAARPGRGRQEPDRWESTRVLTVDFLLEKPPGVKWDIWAPLFGVGGPFKHARPWAVSAGNEADEIALSVQTAELAGSENAHTWAVNTRGVTGPWRITFTLDLPAGTCEAWLNGRSVSTRLFDVVPAGDPRKFKPGLTLATADGASPFLIGQAGTGASGDLGLPTTDLALFGLRVTRGRVYRPAGPPGTRQARLDAPAEPINDLFRYFTPSRKDSQGTAPVGHFRFDDTAGPSLRVCGESFDGLAFWVPKALWPHSGGNAARDLQIFASGQPGILLGSVLDWKGTNLKIYGGLQAIGSLNVAPSYPVALDGCTLAGADCAYYGYRQILNARSMTLAQGGRDFVRLKGCDSSWRDTLVAPASADADVAFRFLADGYGGRHRLEDCLIDNEGGRFASALIDMEQHFYAASRLVLDGVICASVAPGKPLIRLTGFGDDGDRCRPARLEVRGLANAGLDHDTVLRVDGPGWSGSLDVAQLATPKRPGVAARPWVVGDGAGRIKVE